jgi:hypothetical protein
MGRSRLVGAAGGAVFAVLTLAALALGPGPSSANGRTVVEYYTAHGDAAMWQAVLAGLGLVFFMWFAGTFAEVMSQANAVLVSAGAMAAVYLVTLGAWESLGETYRDVDPIDVSTEGYGDAHVLYDVGVGSAHMASFANAAFVGATAAALLASSSWRKLGTVGAGLTVVWLINAPLQVLATSGWSDDVGGIVFLLLLAWIFTLSVVLVNSLRRARGAAPG